MPHCDPEELSLAALGRHGLSAADSEHVASCPECSAELQAQREIVALARRTRSVELTPPPPHVWRAIDGATRTPRLRAVPPATGAAPDDESTITGPQRRRSWLPLAAAAMIGAVLGGAAMTAVVSQQSGPTAPVAESGPTPSIVATTALGPLPDGGRATSGTGSVDVEQVGDSRLLGVTTAALGPTDGYYEVWLIDPDTMEMISIGSVEPGDQVTVLPIPRGVDLAKYSVVDISDEPLNGDPTHSKVSVLRGQLPV